MTGRLIGTILVLVFVFVFFYAWWVYSAQAMCFENQLGDTCFYLNQSERAAQMANPPVVEPASPSLNQGVWPSEEIMCKRSEELHRRLDRFALRGDKGKPWPSLPWCEKYKRGTE
jgi:hypothetical protein